MVTDPAFPMFISGAAEFEKVKLLLETVDAVAGEGRPEARGSARVCAPFAGGPRKS
jgi:hypothetical protein